MSAGATTARSAAWSSCRWPPSWIAPGWSASLVRTCWTIHAISRDTGSCSVWRGHKPFECVGEIVEAQVALHLLAGCARWADAAVIRTLREGISGWPSEQDVIHVFATQSPRFAPADYAQALVDMAEVMRSDPGLGLATIAKLRWCGKSPPDLERSFACD